MNTSTLVLSLGLAAVLSSSATAQLHLASNTDAVSVFEGGAQILSLDAGAINAGRTYLMLGSFAGTTPGIQLLGTPVPLNLDAYLLFTFATPNTPLLRNSLGMLDANGRARVTFELPPIADPSLVGLVVHHAYVVSDSGAVVGASNAVPVTLAVWSLKVDVPFDGSSVGTPEIDVFGRLGSVLAGTNPLVTVNGVPAIVGTAGPNQQDFASSTPVALGPGANTITVTATNAAGHFESSVVVVDYVPLPANNVAFGSGRAYGSLGGAGFVALDPFSRQFQEIPPAPGSGSVDDLSIADGLLFTLDAAGAGHLSVYSLANPDSPQLVSGPVAVPVGPFAGVSAAGGRVVVSGGAGELTVRTYDALGNLGSQVATADLGIGQPDVLLSSGGAFAHVSTDFAGSVGGAGLGVTILYLANPPTSPTVWSQIGLPGAGFTPGGASPANFPIESAYSGNLLVTAHGGGLSLLNTSTVGQVMSTVPLGFGGVNVDVNNGRA